MWAGTVDVNWAKEHHALWAEKEAARGQASPPAGRSTMQPAE
jgi:formate dehydrogenase subunit gamma